MLKSIFHFPKIIYRHKIKSMIGISIVYFSWEKYRVKYNFIEEINSNFKNSIATGISHDNFELFQIAPSHHFEIQELVKACCEYKIPILIEPETDNSNIYRHYLRMNYSRMNKILDLDVTSNILRVQPGVTLKHINSFLKDYNLEINGFGPCSEYLRQVL